MTLEIDRKFATLLSPKLKLFKWTDEKTAAFRCPICGDSKKNKTKKRGYFYVDKSKLWMKCHNCEAAMGFDKFLKLQDEGLYKDYAYEKFRHSNEHRWYEKKQTDKVKDLKESLQKDPEIRDTKALEHLVSIDKLPIGHPGRIYVEDRLIPKEFWSKLYYTENFRKWVNEYIVPNKFKTIGKSDERLVIPFFDKKGNPFAYQGRYIGNDEKVTRYITIHEKAEGLLIYGLERIDFNKPIRVVEGPIDSMFIPNCLAVAGSALAKLLTYKYLDLTFIFDNQPRNATVIKLMQKIINAGKKIVIFPETITQKDINEMIIKGLTFKNLCDILYNHAYQGLTAQLQFNRWKKL